MSGRGGGGGVPKGWMGCPTLCVDPIGQSFLAFKTPLNEKLNRSVHPPERFYTRDVFYHASVKGLTLSVWVDLTNTTRYYSKDEVEFNSNGRTKYVKMSMEGHGKMVGRDEVEAFLRICDEGIVQEGGVVGVHCTHGFNRTGFLICAYLVLRRGLSPAQAMKEFGEKRPPGIYRGEYVEELFKIGGVAEGKVVVVTPAWDTKKTKFGRGEYISHEGFRKHEFPFPKVDVEFEFHLWDVLKEFWKLLGEFRMRDLVVSEVQNGSKLEGDLMMTWVSRGTGFYLFIEAEDRIFLIGDKEEDKYCVWKVGSLRFPEISGGHLKKTVLWGELTKIENPVSGPAIHAFVIADIFCIQGDRSVRNTPLNSRRSLIRQYIMNPRNSAISAGKLVQKKESFALRTKPYFPVSNLPLLLNVDFNFRLELPPRTLNFVPQHLSDTTLEWPWPSAVLMVGPNTEGKTGMVEMVSKEGATVCALSIEQLSTFPNVGEGSVIICEWKDGGWEVGRLIEDGMPESFNDIKRVETSISREELLLLTNK